MNREDLIILGGGISAVYLAWLLSQDKKFKRLSSPSNIRVIEASTRFGGRVHSVGGSYGGQNYGYEAGAARFFTGHKLLNRLLKHFGYGQDSFIEISGDAAYHFPIAEKKGVVINGKWVKTHIREAVNILTKTPQVGKYTTREALVKGGMDKRLVEWLFQATGYPHILEGNAEATINICRQDYLANQKYYLFSHGLETLVEKMVEECRSRGVVFTHGRVSHWNTSTNQISLSDGTTFSGSRIVCAIPPNGLRGVKITGHEGSDIKTVLGYLTPVPLLRQFSMYRKIPEGIPGKLVTSNPIQRQYLGGGGLVQTSYTSGARATEWISMDQESRRNLLVESQIEAYKGVALPKPAWNREYYWDGGIHLWKAGLSVDKMYQKILDCGGDRWWFCGEAYQLEKRWIESALESADHVYKEIVESVGNSHHQQGGDKDDDYYQWQRFISGRKTTKKNRNITKRKKPIAKKDTGSKTWNQSQIDRANSQGRHLIIVSGKVYDVKNWLVSHPGGQSPLQDFLGKDATRAMNGNRGKFPEHYHSPIARNILSNYLVGVFKN